MYVVTAKRSVWFLSEDRSELDKFVQYVLDGCPTPEHFKVWDISNNGILSSIPLPEYADRAGIRTNKESE